MFRTTEAETIAGDKGGVNQRVLRGLRVRVGAEKKTQQQALSSFGPKKMERLREPPRRTGLVFSARRIIP